LFLNSTTPFTGTSVNEIIKRGIPSKKLVLGKPVTAKDANNGWMDLSLLGEATSRGYTNLQWYGGVMFW
jgi:hypothetical protein